MQERLEASVAGRALLNVFLVVFLAATFVYVMPDSVLKSHVFGPADSLFTALGMRQAWGMFSPDPPKATTFVEARIRYTDGTTSTWGAPSRRGPLAYSDYHWHLLATAAGLDVDSRLWPGFARHLAYSRSEPGRDPVEVSLVRRWATIAPPGVSPGLGPWQEQVYYVQPLGATR